MNVPTPTEYLLHIHDGFVYATALVDIPVGEDETRLNVLVRARGKGGAAIRSHDSDGASRDFYVEQFDWENAEEITPQTEVEVDDETGEQFAPDPGREAYIAALKTVLSKGQR